MEDKSYIAVIFSRGFVAVTFVNDVPATTSTLNQCWFDVGPAS